MEEDHPASLDEEKNDIHLSSVKPKIIESMQKNQNNIGDLHGDPITEQNIIINFTKNDENNLPENLIAVNKSNNNSNLQFFNSKSDIQPIKINESLMPPSIEKSSQFTKSNIFRQSWSRKNIGFNNISRFQTITHTYLNKSYIKKINENKKTVKDHRLIHLRKQLQNVKSKLDLLNAGFWNKNTQSDYFAGKAFISFKNHEDNITFIKTFWINGFRKVIFNISVLLGCTCLKRSCFKKNFYNTRTNLHKKVDILHEDIINSKP